MTFKHHSQRKKRIWWPIIAYSLFGLMVYLWGSWALTPLTDSVSLLARPAWWIGEGLSSGTQGLVDFFRNHNGLAIENRRLSAENDRFRTIISAKSQVENDNHYLRQLFGKLENQSRPVVGEVIFLPNFIPEQVLTIDLGRNNLVRPVKVGDRAVVAESVIIGRVATVGSWSSKIKLLSAETDLPVTIGDEHIIALANGAGAGNFSIVLPRAVSVLVGDRVLASTFDNLLLGTVRYIERDPNQPNQTLLVKTPLNLWQLKWLEIYEGKN